MGQQTNNIIKGWITAFQSSVRIYILQSGIKFKNNKMEVAADQSKLALSNIGIYEGSITF